ncbi:MAG TPA: cyclic nucleotide-binding domain-containing protein [Desulfobacterales bacterium]
MTSGVAFSGTLEFLSLGELLQLIGNNGSTGILRLSSRYASEPGMIYVDNGDPVDASNGEKTGLEALFSLFGWTEGEYVFTQESVNRPNVINKNRMEIILDGSRMVDDGKIEKLGPVSFKKEGKGGGDGIRLPVIKGPFVDYMYVVDEEDFYEGDEIVLEGSYGNWMWVILEGVVEIIKKSPSGPRTILQLSDGAFIGNISSLLENQKRNATVRAASRVQLGMLDAQLLANEYAAMSPEMRSLIISLDNRLKQVTATMIRNQDDPTRTAGVLNGKKAVIEQGKKEERVFIINQGTVALARSTERGVVPLCELYRSDFFGHVPFLKMGHEPHGASVFATGDLKIVPLDINRLHKEHSGLSNSFRNIIEHLATCVSVTTMIACEAKQKAQTAA